MSTKVSHAEIVGIPQTDFWSQVYFIEEEGQKKGKLFYYLAIGNQTDEETTALGKTLATDFAKDYEDSSDKPFEALKKSLEKINKTVQALIGVNIEMVAGVILSQVLYVGKINQGKVFLHRDNKLVSLLSQTETISLASGFVKNEDMLIIASLEFIDLVTQETLEKSLDHNSPQDIASGLTPRVLGAPINSRSCCLIIKLTFFDESEKADEQKEDSAVILENTPLVSRLPLIDLSFITDRFFKFNIMPKGKSQKTALSVFFIIIILLTTSIIWGVSNKEEEKKQSEFQKVYADAKNKTDEGKSIIDLNNTQARIFLQTGKDLMEGQLKKLNKKSQSYKKASELLQEANDGLFVISGVYKITSPNIFFDLTLIKDKAAGVKMSLYKKTLSLLDEKNPTVYKLAVDTKAGDILAGGQDIGNAKNIAQGTKTYLFSSQLGVVEIDDSLKKTNVVIKSDKNWGEIADVSTFNNNLYLLDKTHGDIIRFISLENGFSDGHSYLAKDLRPDFTKSVSLAIDGFVWVLNNDGSIVKFGQGRPINFTINGLDQNFSTPSKLFTSDETKNIYILDKGNNRVVVLNKEGLYQTQYQWDGISQVTDLAVLEEEKKLLLLSGSKIYLIELK